jgi:hypothetical protein
MTVKHLLIPVDLKVSSLKTLKLALEMEDQAKLRVILLFPRSLSDSITELLFFSEFKVIQQNMTKEFIEGLEVLRNRYRNSISGIDIRLLAFDNLRYFKALTEHNKIEKIYYPTMYRLNSGGANINIIDLIKRSELKLVPCEWQIDTSDEREALAELIK